MEGEVLVFHVEHAHVAACTLPIAACRECAEAYRLREGGR